MPDSIGWVQFRDSAMGKPHNWNRRTHTTEWKQPPGIMVVWFGERAEEGGV